MVRFVLAIAAAASVFAQTSSFVLGSREYTATCRIPKGAGDTVRVVEVRMTSKGVVRDFEVWVFLRTGWYGIEIETGSEDVARSLVVAYYQSTVRASRALAELVARELDVVPIDVEVADVGSSAVVYLSSAPARTWQEINRYAVFLVQLHLPLLFAVEKYNEERRK